MINRWLKVFILIGVIAVVTVGLGITQQLKALNSTVQQIEFNTSVVVQKYN
jgi:hypothetical protein